MTNKTEKKEKKLTIKKTETGLFYAAFEGGGEIPEFLRGVWTNYNELLGKINFYLSMRDTWDRERSREGMRRLRAKRKQEKEKEVASNENDSA